MGIFSFLLGDRRAERLQRLAETLAAQCEPVMASRLAKHSECSGRYEVRGYIRARSGVVVTETVAQAMADKGFARIAGNGSELHEMVMASLVGRIERRLAERRTTSVRRAA